MAWWRCGLSRLTKLFQLSATERRLLLEAWALLCLVRLALWTMPFRSVRTLLSGTVAARVRYDKSAGSVEQVVNMIRVASRFVPAATCLTAALVAHAMLRREGHEPMLRIGVGRDEDRAFHAHAWVECEGRIVVGNMKSVDEYTPLPLLETATSNIRVSGPAVLSAAPHT